MTILKHINELFAHMHWADAKVWDTILNTPAAQNHEKIKTVIHHYHLTQYAFFYIWNDLPMDFPGLEEFESTSDIAKWASKYPHLAVSYLSGLEEKDLNRVIQIPWSDRLEKVLGQKPEETNLIETMLQVTSHSSYHRGQVNSLIRSMGAEPPLVDFIAWVWFGKPLAKWPVE
jgi:uncharacterized damage-inducible protein DinB